MNLDLILFAACAIGFICAVGAIIQYALDPPDIR